MANENINAMEGLPRTPALQQLLDLINSDNSTSVTLDEVSVASPEAINFAGRNTRVMVTAKSDSPYAGDQEIYYNRLAVTKLGYIGILTETAISAQQLLAMISAQKGVELLAEEFEEIAIPVLEQYGSAPILLKSKAQAIKWHGQTEVEYVFGLPPNVELFRDFLHKTLPFDVFGV